MNATDQIRLAVDLYAGGARGWDIHDTALGLRTLGYETNADAHATAKAAGFDSYRKSVSDTGPSEMWCGKAGLKGSPPYGPWTVAGAGSARAELDMVKWAALGVAGGGTVPYHKFSHPDTGLILEPLRWAMDAKRLGRPFRWIVLEQVREALPMFDLYAELLETAGYHTWAGVLHAEQYGVPQTRTRSAFIASLDKPVGQPPALRAKYKPGQSLMDLYSTNRGVRGWVPMAEALGVKSPAPGAYLRSNYGTGGVAANRGHRTLHQPAPTITRKFNRNKWMLGGEVLNAMTIREASLLQTLPADHPWQGDLTSVQLQIGNAIPPLLAKAILEQVL